MSDFLQPHELEPARLLCPWDFPGKILEWVAISFSRDLPDPGTEPGSPALQVDALLSKPPEKPTILFIVVKNEK